MIYINLAVLASSFFILFRCASHLVDSSVQISNILGLPRILIGVILVGFATTAPELAVSVIASFTGSPDIALGNAVGSVICDDGVALGLAGILAPAAIMVAPRLIKILGVFLLGIDIFAYILILNGILGRVEGAVLISLSLVYFIFIMTRRGDISAGAENKAVVSGKDSLSRSFLIFFLNIAGILIASRFVVWAAVNIASIMSISKVIIGLTIIAIGTSLPEISTCIVASVKGEGELAVGDIIGADILNITWIIGMSALVNPINVDKKTVHFMFPYMLFIVIMMLIFLGGRSGLTRKKGFLLFVSYTVYLILTITFFY